MQKNLWHIKCKHTPEIIDRILMHFRKRGMLIESFNYTKKSESLAQCEIEFNDEPENAKKIYNNLLRTIDIIEVIPKQKEPN